MNKRILWVMIFSGLLFVSFPAGSTMSPETNRPDDLITNIYKKISSLTTKDIQKSIGRKLTLKEKVVFIFLKKKLRMLLKNRWTPVILP